MTPRSRIWLVGGPHNDRIVTYPGLPAVLCILDAAWCYHEYELRRGRRGSGSRFNDTYVYTYRGPLGTPWWARQAGVTDGSSRSQPSE